MGHPVDTWKTKVFWQNLIKFSNLEKERAVLNGLVYGTTGKTGVKLKHFQQQEVNFIESEGQGHLIRLSFESLSFFWTLK